MATDKKIEAKKLEEFKETPENKAAVAAHAGVPSEDGKSEGKIVEEKKEEKKQDSKNQKDSRPAVAKVKTDKKKKEVGAELTREYVVPLRRGFLNVPRYRRAKKAVRTLKEFMVRHMNIRDGDLRKVKVDISLNNEIWFRGIKNPLHKIKVKAVKKDGIVTVTLADPSDYVKFKLAREEKAAKKAMEGAEKVKPAKKDKEVADKDKDGVADEKQEEEDKKAGAEMAASVAKGAEKEMKRTASGKHAQKTAPVRKVLK